jgi:MSHA pilin protein MshC
VCAQSAQSARAGAAGFTLTELVVVMIIAGILSVFAISRINTTSFGMEGFTNQATAMVRYAQKIAISQRRTVFVVTTTSRISLCYTDATCASQVHEPPSTSAFFKDAPSGVTLSAGNFSFDALGKSAGASISVSASGETTRFITIEANTGYVH